jgi:redox-sensitive bicupin YhaK (pirin superfamily)
VQLWVALPESRRETAPAFDRYEALPALALPGGSATVIMGELDGHPSPARAFSPMVGADLAPDTGGRLIVPLDPGFEHALVLLRGQGELDGHRLDADTLYYLGSGRRELCLASVEPTRALLLGGAPFGESILMWWNFVARTTDEIVAAREDWEAGRRFGTVRDYPGERLPAPPLVARPAAGR